MAVELIRYLFGRFRDLFAGHTMRKWDRFLPLDEMLVDRWDKGRMLGFGKGSNVYENAYIYGKPRIGKNVWIGPFTVLDATGGLTIGDGCSISCGAMVFTHSTHMNCVSEGKEPKNLKPVSIGDYVYLGSGAMVLPGIRIGDHSIIGAGAVVTKDVPPFTMAVGVPAKKIGTVKFVKGKVSIIKTKKA